MIYVMDQQRALHSGCLVAGVRTPPVRRNSKLASLGRIFKPWKWRKKKNEKLKPSATAEKKAAARQKSDNLVKRNPGETETELDLACGGNVDDPDTPTQSDAEDKDEEPAAPLASASEDLGSDFEVSTVQDVTEDSKSPGGSGQSEDGEDESALLSDRGDELPTGKVEAAEGKQQQTAAAVASVASAVAPPRRAAVSPPPRRAAVSPPPRRAAVSPPPRRAVVSPPPKVPLKLLPRLGSLDHAPSVPVKKSPATLPRNFTLPKDPHGSLLRGRILTPAGSPHLGSLHSQLPPSCIIEELHRALATKHRQDSFQTKEARSSLKRRLDGRLSRTSSTEREPAGQSGSKQVSDENKENWRLDEYLNDQDGWNDSIISGTLPRRMRKELLTVKLRNRPSQRELEDRNIFPVRSDQERQEIRQQIETKLSKRLSQRPAVEELESRNILKQRNDQTEQEERREIKQRLNRKLNQRPTVDELRDRKILIRFSDYVEVAKAQDYDRRADKPWTRLSAADKAAIRKELNEFKSNEMEVHTSSKHLTRFHRP
ncbi:phosphatase and actin regulator 3b isoform X2 [Pseudoliparis swirei]|uniref:phosphatase and actin regulator 3b isoform X2 n=1 Tax=Pseudoliparis swirei TaxID=2059687 RepID=UPI0024BEEC45|nr:phosphatase and actin regulator 3b isoform X2 [Pseudoliparis swirei]XP_056294539.1 phosphatase and actin regulator 3b isoform X2 [Pseudoliparis swirei]